MPTIEQLLNKKQVTDSNKNLSPKDEVFEILRMYDNFNEELPKMPWSLQARVKEEMNELSDLFRVVLNDMYQSVTRVGSPFTFDEFFKLTVNDYNGVEIVNADYERTWSVIDNLKRITEQRIELLLHIMLHIDKMLDETDLEVSYDDIRLALDLVGNHDLEVFECVARFTEPSIKEFLASIR